MIIRMRCEGVQRATAKPSARLRRGEIFLPHIVLFLLKTIALPKAEVSRLRARPKGFPIALWKPSGRPFDAMLLMQNSIRMRSDRLHRAMPCHWRAVALWKPSGLSPCCYDFVQNSISRYCLPICRRRTIWHPAWPPGETARRRRRTSPPPAR